MAWPTSTLLDLAPIPGGTLIIPPGTRIRPNSVVTSPTAPTTAASQWCCVGCIGDECGNACPTALSDFLQPGCSGVLAAVCSSIAPPGTACSSVVGARNSTCSGFGAVASQAGCATFLELNPSVADTIMLNVCGQNPKLYECAAISPTTSDWSSPVSGGKTFNQVIQSLGATYPPEVVNRIRDNQACWWWPSQGALGQLGGSGAFVTESMKDILKGCKTATLCASAVSNVAAKCPGGASSCPAPINPIVIQQFCDVNYRPVYQWSIGLINATSSVVCFTGQVGLTLAAGRAIIKSTNAGTGFVQSVNGVRVTQVDGAGRTSTTPLAAIPDTATPCVDAGCTAAVGVARFTAAGDACVPLYLMTARCNSQWYLGVFPTVAAREAWFGQLKEYLCNSSLPMPLPRDVTAPDTWQWSIANLGGGDLTYALPPSFTPVETLSSGSVLSDLAYGDTAPFSVRLTYAGAAMPAWAPVQSPIPTATSRGATATAGLNLTGILAVFGSGAAAAAYAAQVVARGASAPLLQPQNAAPPVAATWTVRSANALTGTVTVSAPGQQTTVLDPKEFVEFTGMADGDTVTITTKGGGTTKLTLSLPANVQTVVASSPGPNGVVGTLYRNAVVVVTSKSAEYLAKLQSVVIPGDAGRLPLPDDIIEVDPGHESGGAPGGGGGPVPGGGGGDPGGGGGGGDSGGGDSGGGAERSLAGNSLLYILLAIVAVGVVLSIVTIAVASRSSKAAKLQSSVNVAPPKTP